MSNPDFKRIYLTGYMGAGKSTIGKLLAALLRYEFLDTDRELVRQFGKPVTKVFQEEGEAVFRQAELELLKELATREGMIIATGGGTLAREETFTVAYESGYVVYLKAPVELLYERVIFSPKDRPLIDVPNPEESFRKRFETRATFYERAHWSVETPNRKPSDVAHDIATHVRQSQQGQAQQTDHQPSQEDHHD